MDVLGLANNSFSISGVPLRQTLSGYMTANASSGEIIINLPFAPKIIIMANFHQAPYILEHPVIITPSATITSCIYVISLSSSSETKTALNTHLRSSTLSINNGSGNPGTYTLLLY